MKCVINLYGFENINVREIVFDINEEIVEQLDEIAINENKSIEDILCALVENFVEGVVDG